MPRCRVCGHREPVSVVTDVSHETGTITTDTVTLADDGDVANFAVGYRLSWEVDKRSWWKKLKQWIARRLLR